MLLGLPRHRLCQIDEIGGKLRRPDDVREIDVDIGISSGEPEPVLAELVGGRRRHDDQLDGVAGLLFEIHDLLAQLGDVLADRADGQRQFGGMRSTRPGSGRSCEQRTRQ